MSEQLEPEAEAPQTKKQFKMKKESGLKTLLKKALAKNDPGIIIGHGSLLSVTHPIFPHYYGTLESSLIIHITNQYNDEL